MIRMPDGIGGQRFFQKHWEQARPGLRRERHGVLGPQGREARVPAVQQPADAAVARAVGHARVPRLAFARAARARRAIEEHRLRLARSSRSRPRSSTIPTTCSSTSTPTSTRARRRRARSRSSTPIAFEKGKEVAFWLRELLHGDVARADREDLGQDGPARLRADQAHASTSTPRATSRSWSAATSMRLHPKDITLEWSVPKRTGKIFMDYNMNVRGKTLNVAYSPRGEPGAPVSMPLTWEELAERAPARLPHHQRGRAPARRPATAGATRSTQAGPRASARRLATPRAPKRKRKR